MFDVFGDCEARGYLRNFEGLKDLSKVKRVEHRIFLKNLSKAMEYLKGVETITYQDVLHTHEILFQDFYPWAGQDRQAIAPEVAIVRAGRNDLFVHPRFTQSAVHYALKLGQDRAYMAAHPGEVMGHLAHAHPFLDGNGRTLMVVHNELAHRAGISIDWIKTSKIAYLEALTREIDRPGIGELDTYLKPFVGAAVPPDEAAATLTKLRGLAGAANPESNDIDKRKR
jgi:cell filamentation protein